MKYALKHFPELEGDELQYILNTVEGLSEEQLEIFKSSYKARRRDPVLFLVLALLGLLGIAGIHRVVAGQIGIGILYFFTAGLCFIGTIVDMINYKSFSFEYNRKQAIQILREMNL
jgi:TM2 domain-containing membrane protein YozV